MNLPAKTLVVVRGGGDLATGVVWRLRACGFPVIVLELPGPLTVRRSVALSTAVHQGRVEIEGQTDAQLVGVRVSSFDEACALAGGGDVVPVLISPSLPAPGEFSVIVDARLAKSALDCRIDDAAFVVGLGPGYVVGEHCHAAVETQRGPRLGRVLWNGTPEPNTGTPGTVGGRSTERVLRSPVDGEVRWDTDIGDLVKRGKTLGSVVGVRQRVPVLAPFDGLIRGLIIEGANVRVGLKIGDVDPRVDVNPHEISDKALAIGGGVVEAVFRWLRSA